MAHASATSIDRPAPPQRHPASTSDHLMPLGAEAQLFCALIPQGAAADDVEIMNTRFAGRGKNASWLPIPATRDQFAKTIDTLKLLGNLVGLSIHSPFQQVIFDHLDSVSPRGRFAGLADVARRTPDNGWEGDLAALDAVRRTLRAEGINPKGARTWLVGSEGSAVAAAFSLAEQGISSLTVVDDQVGPAIALAARVQAAFPRVAVSVGIPDARSIDIVIDGTSTAGSGYTIPAADPARLRRETLVIEATARQQIGPFADSCLKAGLTVVAGDCLLVHLLNSYDEYFGWSRIPYKDGSLLDPFTAAA